MSYHVSSALCHLSSLNSRYGNMICIRLKAYVHAPPRAYAVNMRSDSADRNWSKETVFVLLPSTPIRSIVLTINMATQPMWIDALGVMPYASSTPPLSFTRVCNQRVVSVITTRGVRAIPPHAARTPHRAHQVYTRTPLRACQVYTNYKQARRTRARAHVPDPMPQRTISFDKSQNPARAGPPARDAIRFATNNEALHLRTAPTQLTREPQGGDGGK